MTIQTEKLGPVDRFFSITKRGSTKLREIRGGAATFFAMCYIVVLNPIILTSAPIVHGYKPSFVTVACVTALIAGLMTVMMGALGRYPFAIAAGLGINAIVAFQMAPVIGYEGAMGAIVAEGVITTILVLTGVRKALFNAIPLVVKQAIGIGIGLFIAFIGFVDGGLITGIVGAPPVSLGVAGQLASWPNLVFLVVLFLAAILLSRKVPGAIIISILTGTVLSVIIEAVAHVGAVSAKNPGGWTLNVPTFAGKQLFTWPDLSVIGHFSLAGIFSGGVVLGIVFIFTLILSDLFDTLGTVQGVGGEAGLLDKDQNLPGLRNVLLADSLAAAIGGAAGVSSNTTYVESAAGVGEGARTGLASVVTGVLFIIAMFFSPLAQIIPSEAAAPVLVVVGFLMIGDIVKIPWREDASLAIPAFLGIVVMPFTFSITNGIGAAIIAYVVLRVATGNARKVGVMLWITAALFVIYFAQAPIRALFGV